MLPDKEAHESIKNDYKDFVKFCVDFTDLIPRLIGVEIDRIEKKIKDAVPGVIHINIEIN